MKAPFKPLSLAIAVATASAGYAGIVNAQAELAGNTGLGDLAIVPYYTVNDNLTTGVSVINSSARTQVVKIRLRRATDSMDALDFNVVLSPQDVWTGYVQKAENDEIQFVSNDNSCTVPLLPAVGYFTMPDIYRLGAEQGYIEVLGMGAPVDESESIAVNAKHNETTGVPLNCERVSDNFRRGDTPTDYGVNPPASGRNRGVISSVQTLQWGNATGSNASLVNDYNDGGNVLKVSYFIKSDIDGNEFGGDAVHIANFMDGATITNQTVGINEGDLQGFDHPDLNGGAPTSDILGIAGSAPRGSYDPLRVALGATSVINDWSNNKTDLFSVDTDWVVTTPGQYLMTILSIYIDSLEPNGDPCLEGDPALAYDDDEDSDTFGENCDFRDIPLTVAATVYDREEDGVDVDEDDLVVSPQPPIPVEVVNFDREANVVQWGTVPVLGSDKNVVIPGPEGAEAGWAQVSVEANDDTIQAICDFTDYGALPLPYECTSTSTPVPLVGFVAWERSFTDMPEANYGRIVDHSYTSN